MAFARARAGLARSIDNGNFFFAVSGVLGACAGAMYVVEQRNENIRATVAALQVDIATERRRQQEEAAKPFEFSDRPVLFSARVTRREHAQARHGLASAQKYRAARYSHTC